MRRRILKIILKTCEISALCNREVPGSNPAQGESIYSDQDTQLVTDQCFLKPFFDWKFYLGSVAYFKFACQGFEPVSSGLQMQISHQLLVVSKNGFNKNCSVTHCASYVKLTA